MRLIGISSLFFSAVAAQYFSEGWAPGQAVPTEAATPALDEAFKPAATATSAPTPAAKWNWQEFSSKNLDFERIMTEGPIATVLSGIGINASEHLEQARLRAAERGWDDRVPLLTDENYELLVKNETFDSPEDAEKRTWFVIVTVGKQDPMSKLVDEAYDQAYQLSLDAGDAPHVKWARVDYLAVTEITTNWMVWKPPTLMVIRENGRSLRFYRPSQIRLQPELLHEFVVQEGWKETEAWSGPWAPGGDREPYLRMFAIVSRKTYNVISYFPRWVILLVTGAIGSMIINLFHRNDNNAPRTSGQPQITPAERAKQSISERANASGKAPSNMATPTKRKGKKA